MAAAPPSTENVFPPALRLLGDLTVHGSAHIACEVRGRVIVTDHLHVDPQAEVHGEIRSGSLKVVSGAKVKAVLAIGKAAHEMSGWRWFLLRLGFRL